MTRWDRQFYESVHEARVRQHRARAKLRAEGKCWQCAKLVADCRCPNITHPKVSA